MNKYTSQKRKNQAAISSFTVDFVNFFSELTFSNILELEVLKLENRAKKSQHNITG